MANSLDKWVDKLAVVTGVTAGIGEAITVKLIQSGVNVLGLARRKEKLEQLTNRLKIEKGKFYPFVADVCKEEDILRAFEWADKNVGPVHILINNAGVRKHTNLVEGDTKLWKEILDTNVLGLCIATREAFKSMRKYKIDGHIIHINSITGHTVIYLPQASLYPASKYAVTALTETLRQELNSVGSKIKVSSISPGRVDTEFRSASNLQDDKDLPHLKSDDVADAILYVLGTPPHVQVHEIMIHPTGGT